MRIIQYTILLFFTISAAAQQNYSLQKKDKDYYTALELFEKEKYSSSQRFFDEYSEKNKNSLSLKKISAEYYAALCAINLFNDDAEYRVTNFTNSYPESHYVNPIKQNMGENYYSQKKWKRAIDWFEQVNQNDLSESKKTELNFKIGYSHFQLDDLEEARITFYKIKDSNSKYASPATYYYSHINYNEENYETALQGFLKLTDDETFGGIVPYYITQIYYLQNKYDEVINYAPGLMGNIIPKRKAEVARIIGESYFRRNNFSDAIHYLNIYGEEAGSTSSQDKYLLAYCYYQLNQWPQAIELFEKISNGNNELSQNALYHLADCYLKTGEKDKARVAFSGASNLDFNEKIKEDALFNYAKLTYELDYSPFNEAIRAFNKYLRLYPESEKNDEVYNFLVISYLNAKNYRLALSSIEKIQNRNNQIDKAYQQIAFYRGLELFNNLQFNDAIDLFDKSLKYKQYNKNIEVRAYYWKAEAYFRMGDYNKSIELFQQFTLLSGAFNLKEYNLAHYNLGYAYFNQKKYAEALSWFRKYANLASNDKTNLLADTYNRIGDCMFVDQKYWPALENYDKSIEIGLYDVDYALFQKGFGLGLVNRPERKIETLNQLLKEQPNSAYIDDAIYELGRTYLGMQNNSKAQQYFEKLITEHENSSYLKKSLVQLGLIYYNTDRNQEALDVYKKVVENYSGSDEAQDALLGIKNIYLDMNDVDSYFAYVKNKGNYVTISASEKDSLSYKAAENIYMAGNCEEANKRLISYLEDFPNGTFKTNANFYLGDCYYQTQKYDNALVAFNEVISKPINMFTEPALLGASRINFSKENYEDALENYIQIEKVTELKTNLIESRLGQLRCYYILNNYEKTIEAANEVLLSEKISSEMEREARYKIAKSYLALGRDNDALDEFRQISNEVSSKEGAESKYMVCELTFKQGDLDKTEKEIFEFVDQSTPHQHWMAKSFLLLTDLYIQKDDLFQAGHTVQSIIDFYEVTDDGILDAAKERKNKIEAMEKKLNKEPELQDIEINVEKNVEGKTNE